MRYIKKFNLTSEYRGIEPFSMDLRDGLNIVVGENGSGKSTLLDCLMNFNKMDECQADADMSSTYRFLDTEKQNPRITSLNSSNGSLFRVGVASRFMSHGEAIYPFVKAVEKMRKEVVFIDEPESGVSLSNQVKLLKAFEKAVSRGCQLVITTHSYVIISSCEEVFSLDHRKWVSSGKYLDKVLKPTKPIKRVKEPPKCRHGVYLHRGCVKCAKLKQRKKTGPPQGIRK